MLTTLPYCGAGMFGSNAGSEAGSGHGRLRRDLLLRIDRRLLRSRGARSCRCRERRLAPRLGRLELSDLALHRLEELLALAQLALDRRPLGRALGDDVRLLLRARP